jgi:hypothetical protein
VCLGAANPHPFSWITGIFTLFIFKSICLCREIVFLIKWQYYLKVVLNPS